MNRADTCVTAMNYVRCQMNGELGSNRRHAATFIAHCFDGEEKGLKGRQLYKYARRKTCGFDPWLWITLAGFLVNVFRLWLEWRKEHPKHWGVV